jgi:ankyrin repeat protein
LIEHKADLTRRNSVGQTPLLFATNAFRYDLAYAMLLHGADWNAADPSGIRLLDQLNRYGQQKNIEHSGPRWQAAVDVARWLTEHGAKVSTEFFK